MVIDLIYRMHWLHQQILFVLEDRLIFLVRKLEKRCWKKRESFLPTAFFLKREDFFGYMLVSREANLMDHSKRLFFLCLLQKRNSKANKQIHKNGTSSLF